MFNKYIRYFNQNRLKVIIIVFVVIFALIFIHALNQIAKDENEKQVQQMTNRVVVDKDIRQSVIDEGSVTEEIAKKNQNLINDFIKFCNSKDTKKAYELLSNDCKKILFPTETDFINNYYNIVFNEIKQYELENWISNGNIATYKVRYTNDVLAQGGYAPGSTIEDYYTIIKQNEEYKLNINKFVNREQINKYQSKDNFTINVVARENYIDYQIYEIDFNNQNIYPVRIYDNNSSWKIIDKNELEYLAFMNEIEQNNMRIESRVEKRIKVKYAKIYNTNRKINKINFSNMYFENGMTPDLFSFEIEL